MAESNHQSNSQSSVNSLKEVDDVPLLTTRTFDNLVDSFGSQLAEQALCNMRLRGSSTPTDADLHKAYRELTATPFANKTRRWLGDALLIAGGCFLPLWETSTLLTVGGAIICVAGLYVRESAE